MSDGPLHPDFAPVPRSTPSPVVDLRPVAEALHEYGVSPRSIEHTLKKVLTSSAAIDPTYLPHHVAGVLLGIELGGDHASCTKRLQWLIELRPTLDSISTIEYVQMVARMYVQKLLEAPGIDADTWQPVLNARMVALMESLTNIGLHSPTPHER